MGEGVLVQRLRDCKVYIQIISRSITMHGLNTPKIIAKNVLLYSISGLAIESKKPYFKQDSE